MGLRPTRSLSRGHKNSAPNMPSGYADVRYPTYPQGHRRGTQNVTGVHRAVAYLT